MQQFFLFCYIFQAMAMFSEYMTFGAFGKNNKGLIVQSKKEAYLWLLPGFIIIALIHFVIWGLKQLVKEIREDFK